MPLSSSSGHETVLSPDMPANAGGRSMAVDPSAIPSLVSALQCSLDRVGVQIEHAITELRIRPWAGDPVSSSAAEEFNQRSLGGGSDALTALCGCRDRLQNAAESLTVANEQYQQVDDANSTLLAPN